MIDGVRMRLLVMVWNITVEAAMAVPTSAMPSSLRPRNGMMKLHEPRASRVMNSTTAASASSAMMPRLAAGEKRPQRRRAGRAVVTALLLVLTDTRGPPQEQQQEQRPADEADHGADGDLVGEAQHPAEDVAQQHEAGAEHRQPRDGAAHVVADQQAHHVGHHQPDEGDGAD